MPSKGVLTRLLCAGDGGGDALTGAMSFAEVRRALCDAFTAAFPGSRGDIVDVYADHCIISDGTGALFEVPYTIDDNGRVATGDMTKVRKRVDYVAIQSASHLTAAADETVSPDYGYRWRVQIVDAGPDRQNIANYGLDVLKAATPAYEGARVFALSQGQHDNPANPYGKSVRDLVGWLSDVAPNATGLEGTFNILRSASWLRDMITDAWQRGKKDIVGLSHDVMAKTTASRSGGPRQVEKIVRVDSVDVVYDPIAGGKLLRMAAAFTAGQKEAEMLEKLLAALKAQRPDLYATIEAKVNDKTVTEDEVAALLASAIVPAQTAPDVAALVSAAVKKAMDDAGTAAGQDALKEAKLLSAGLTLKDELRESGLPEISQAKLRKQFEGRIFEVEALRAAITEEKEYLDRLAGSGIVTGSGQVRVGNEEPEKLQAAFDKLLGVTVDDKFKDVPALSSIRAAYTRVTGDETVSGSIKRDALKLGEGLMEMMRLPAAYASTSFSFLLGTSMYRRLVQDYRALDFNEDILISFVRGATDFKTLESIRVGYFGDLPDITPETVDYPELDVTTDEEVTFAINQKGGIVTITRKVIKNDDLRFITRVPQRIARAARRTKAKRCWNKIINNATYKADSLALFHATHGNLGSTALTADATGIAALTARLNAMYSQKEKDSDEILALEALHLWVPRALLEVAKVLNSAWPGAATPNPHAGRFGVNHERIVVNKLTTDTNDWGLVADKADVELMEIAYMDGQQEPELFVADNPLVGQMFVADKIQYKVRHEYEVEIDDYRGFDKSVI